METLFVGIDVSKQKLDVAITFNGTDFQTQTFQNSIPGFKKISLWLKKFNYSSIHFCLESTNIYHNELVQYLKGVEKSIVSVVNPYQIKHFGQSINTRTKTDKMDSCLIARFVYINRPQETSILSNEQKELRELTRFLESLIKDKTRQLIKLETLKNSNLREIVLQKIDFINLQIDEIEKLIKNFIQNHSIIKHKVSLLKSIDGIGEKTAWILLSEMIDDKNVSSKAQVAYAGLDPIEKQSGSSLNGKARISSKGNSRLRKYLYMPALSRIRHNGIFSEFYHKLISKGKPKKVALTAVMKKMLITASGVLKNDTPFRSDWTKIQQEQFALIS